MIKELDIGDYVEFVEPYVGNYPVGRIIDITTWNKIIKNDINKKDLVYEIETPSGHQCWREKFDLIQSSQQRYMELNMIARLEN